MGQAAAAAAAEPASSDEKSSNLGRKMMLIYSVYQNYCDSSLKDHGHYNFKARHLIFNGLVAYPFLPMLLKNGLDWPSFDQVTSVLVQVVQFWLCPYVVKLRPKKAVFCQFWPFLRENKWCP